jgi:hypothetical protein
MELNSNLRETIDLLISPWTPTQNLSKQPQGPKAPRNFNNCFSSPIQT